jgi:SAM-dependent methyltransferase
MNGQPISWVSGKPATSPFAHPRGLRGYLAGLFMQWTNKQDDLVDVLRLRPGDRVLEVGYGPGYLIRMLTRRTGASLIQGVDPSPRMRELAARNNHAAVRAGRVQLGLGSAQDTGLPGQSVDRVVAVNNVAIWPDLAAGIRELYRVLRPGGMAVVAWHGGVSPSPLTKRLRLSGDRLDQIEDALQEAFPAVARGRLHSLEVFLATR